jgi:hypothetical protein
MKTREELLKELEDARAAYYAANDARDIAEIVYLDTIAALNAYDKENT